MLQLLLVKYVGLPIKLLTVDVKKMLVGVWFGLLKEFVFFVGLELYYKLLDVRAYSTVLL